MLRSGWILHGQWASHRQHTTSIRVPPLCILDFSTPHFSIPAPLPWPVGPPLYPPIPHQRVDTGFGKLVYARNFLNSLIPKMMRKSLTDPQVAEVIDLERLQKVTTIGKAWLKRPSHVEHCYITTLRDFVEAVAAQLPTQVSRDVAAVLNVTLITPQRRPMPLSCVA